jgi:hypothetical protein
LSKFSSLSNFAYILWFFPHSRKPDSIKGRKDLEARKMLRIRYGDWFLG